MSTVKSKNLQVGVSSTSTDNFTIYQPATPDGTLRVGVGNADSPTEVGKFDSNGYVSTNAPMFYARASAATSLSNSTWTKIVLATEEVDLTNDYDTTNSRFTPSVEGYYQIIGTYFISTATTARPVTAIYKNGTEAFTTCWVGTSSAGGNNGIVSAIIYANGSTDYFELYGNQNSGSTKTSSTASTISFFQGTLVRAV
ncbi:MAG: hypothetical protein ACR2M9_04550 [Cyanophyceae cyanobacterium]